MKIFSLWVLVLLSTCADAQELPKIKLKKGNWIAELALNDHDVLPFNLVVSQTIDGYSFMVENGEEMIQLNQPEQKGDSLYVRFPFFNSMLVFTADSKRSINGYWVNFNKGKDYKIPFSSRKKRSQRFSLAKKKVMDTHLDGKWEVTFEPNTNSSYPAVGVFSQTKGKSEVSGTFLTETGDYRFLDGNIVGDSLFLSCFDGSHAFLFKAGINQDGTLDGKFFSGKHWSSEWIGKRNENVELKNPEELTYLIDGKDVAFQLKDMEGQDFTFPNENYEGKVTIIQIMGTWCPNCLDETKYFKELYDKYHKDGLEIISIAYETGNTTEDYIKSVTRLRNKLNLNFTFLIGGPARKNLASEHFDMLNEIISFPTTIFIDRNGEVKRIHTGFNGPGTGEYYTEYVRSTNSLIENLLAQ
ncbi:MAG: TlpA family protein disulfide reductase [Flavobacteriales bacterium]|nr:TlpA family protein disulfide reductase [Flavobacteriales bacterium]